MNLTISELVTRFPDFRVGVIVADGLSIGEERDAGLEAYIRRAESNCRERHAGLELSAIPGVAAWRSAYKGFGIKKTSYRSSVERLIKRVLAGDSLPAINSFVDAYNAVSLAYGLCIGADDLDRIVPPLAFRFARQGDSFLDMAAQEGENADDPPKEGEVVLADTRHVLCRRWNWRQDMRSAISPQTSRAVITVQANGWGELETATSALAGLLDSHCGGRTQIAYADAATPAIGDAAG